MTDNGYDLIVIGCGSGGLSLGLFMNKAGFRVLMLARSEDEIGGECLNDGCVPSKALIHVAKLIHHGRLAGQFGLETKGEVEMKKVWQFVSARQAIIRGHENLQVLTAAGIHVELGDARFTGKREIETNGKRYSAKNIVIATGSQPRKLAIAGVDQVPYFDNKNIFEIDYLPERLLVVGAGPVSIELAQAMARLGSKVTVVDNRDMILAHDEAAVTKILLEQLQKEGLQFFLEADIISLDSPNEAVIRLKNGSSTIQKFDALFVGIGRTPDFKSLDLENAGVDTRDGKIIVDDYLRTTNKNIFVCGDVAGSLQFSHIAEFHARILINNFFSPFKKKLINDHLSWVTFTDPELATFGLGEKQLRERNIPFEKLEHDFAADDRAVTDNYPDSKLILYISQGGLFRKKKILGGTMLAPHAGELVQELILANGAGIPVDLLFRKIYPYPVAARMNQQLIVEQQERRLTAHVKKWLRRLYQLFG